MLGALDRDYWAHSGGVTKEAAEGIAKRFGFDFGEASARQGSRFNNYPGGGGSIRIDPNDLKDGLVNRLMLAEEIQHGLDRATNEAGRFARRHAGRGLSADEINDLFHIEHFERVLRNHRDGVFDFLTDDDILGLEAYTGTKGTMMTLIELRVRQETDECGNLEEFTPDLFLVVDTESSLHLTDGGLPKVGTTVIPGMVLVGKVGVTSDYDPNQMPSEIERLTTDEETLKNKYGPMFSDGCLYVPEGVKGVVKNAYFDKSNDQIEAVVEIEEMK